MPSEKKNVLLVSMPFAGTAIPSIQLPVLEGYLKERDALITTRHLYLKAAEFYGINNYNFLIYPPNDSYTAQMVFSKYVFPEHWKKNVEKFREYFEKTSAKSKAAQQGFSFEQYVEQTDRLYQWVIDRVDWGFFDIIGFTLNYGQLLPSLAVAKKIKEWYPEKKIVFGGSRTVGKLGMRVLEAFDSVDFIVSGEGEEPLYRLASGCENYESIPGLIFRKGDEVVWNKEESLVDMNRLPIPSYDAFFEELAVSSPEVQQYFQYFGRLPVEISRGCWWNRCSFCNLNVQHCSYREKHVDEIVEEIQWLSDRYRMLAFQMIGNTLLKKNYRVLCEKIKQLGKDFSFFIEARAGDLQSMDYQLLKEAGFTMMQTGVESFSRHYLHTMNKGTRVIDNIAALKFCKENGIHNSYNIIVEYPNEEPVDFEETQKNIQTCKAFLDPPQIAKLRVVYGSHIHRHPKEYNIERLVYAPVDAIMYPAEFLEKGFNFVYDFVRLVEYPSHPWETFVEEWKTEREQRALEGYTSQMVIDRLVFYFVDGGSFLKIYDKRARENIRIFVLDGNEREIFLACLDVISFQELQNRFPSLPDFELAVVLHTFEKAGLVFVEDEWYLSLPLRCSQVSSQTIKKEEQQSVSIPSVVSSL